MSTTAPWNIQLDVPESLYFAAFVGEKEHFQADNNQLTLSNGELQWRTWWATLPVPSNDFMEELVQVVKSGHSQLANPTLSKLDFNNFGFYPPNFDNLDSLSVLQKLLRHYWPEYNQTAKLERIELAKNIGKLFSATNIPQLVREIIHEVGKADQFELVLDFTPWPADYVREISKKHLVISTSYLEPAKQTQFAELLKGQITKLL